mmetsp:Transcript_66630/g.139090  ORF Transcript_66630/g.139090 Transcript_66630/m.139090 type:complete len:318 (-) Transcript_66630:1534-2487(-)
MSLRRRCSFSYPRPRSRHRCRSRPQLAPRRHSGRCWRRRPPGPSCSCPSSWRTCWGPLQHFAPPPSAQRRPRPPRLLFFSSPQQQGVPSRVAAAFPLPTFPVRVLPFGPPRQLFSASRRPSPPPLLSDVLQPFSPAQRLVVPPPVSPESPPPYVSPLLFVLLLLRRLFFWPRPCEILPLLSFQPPLVWRRLLPLAFGAPPPLFFSSLQQPSFSTPPRAPPSPSPPPEHARAPSVAGPPTLAAFAFAAAVFAAFAALAALSPAVVRPPPHHPLPLRVLRGARSVGVEAASIYPPLLLQNSPKARAVVELWVAQVRPRR